MVIGRIFSVYLIVIHNKSNLYMRIWIIVLKIFGYTWLVLAGLVITAGIIGVWIKEGFSGVQNLLSPFNVINYIVTLVTLAPGLGAIILAKKLEEKRYWGA